jgi:hypothetical protein
MKSEIDQTVAEPSTKVIPSGKTIHQPRKWQERLLPLMINLLVALTVFFFIATFFQISYLHWSILQYPELDLDVSSAYPITTSATSSEDQFASRKFELLARLEAYIIERRYHEASVDLMSSTWLRYLGFITGMILALIGASFILGKLQEAETEVVGKGSGVDISLKTASPGIILAVLGTVLMFATIIDKDYRNIVDAPIYITSSSGFDNLELPTAIPVSLDDLAAPDDRVNMGEEP